jgi:hypothetical protein
MVGSRDGEFVGLRWRDVSFKRTDEYPFGSITWYASIQKADRKKHEHTVLMNDQASATLARWQTQTRGVGVAFVFPDPRDRTKPLSYYDVKRWLKRAEVKAGLSHEKQGGGHALRRGWATLVYSDPWLAVPEGYEVNSCQISKSSMAPIATRYRPRSPITCRAAGLTEAIISWNAVGPVEAVNPLETADSASLRLPTTKVKMTPSMKQPTVAQLKTGYDGFKKTPADAQLLGRRPRRPPHRRSI